MSSPGVERWVPDSRADKLRVPHQLAGAGVAVAVRIAQLTSPAARGKGKQTLRSQF